MSTTDLSRRGFLMASAFGFAAPGVALAQPTNWSRISDAEWKKRLSQASYMVLRHEATEPPGSSPLLKEHRKGVFACLGCGNALFKSDWKYESGTGWPSFWTVLPKAVGTKTDYKIGVPRKEYHCARCGGHQGHIFEDGPKPTGLRYCNNGLALKFIPA